MPAKPVLIRSAADAARALQEMVPQPVGFVVADCDWDAVASSPHAVVDKALGCATLFPFIRSLYGLPVDVVHSS